tara:strand:+ start:201 stop:842 length:642 start_codon:yes stop_codon:yes gene_type:complete
MNRYSLLSAHQFRTLKYFIDSNNYSTKFKKIFDTNSVTSLVNNIRKFADENKCIGYEKNITEDECKNKVKGDIWEIFALFWLNSFGGDRGLNLFNITNANRDERGIDMYGTNYEGNTAIIQVKYKFNENSSFQKGELETFAFAAIGSDITRSENENVKSVFLFTSTKPNWKLEKDICVIDIKKIKERATNKNLGFWNTMKNEIESALNFSIKK